MDKISSSTYVDFQGLNNLQHKASIDPAAAKKEVAEQFESLMVQMLMKSMRDANQALTANSDSDEQSAMYHDLFDKQLSLVIAHSGTGLAEMIEASLDKSQAMTASNNSSNTEQMPLVPQGLRPIADAIKPTNLVEKGSANTNANLEEQPAYFDSTSDFVKTLWASAKEAAAILGADPKFLIAQAALETNWGKNILSMVTGKSTYNLFNIKADKSWEAPSTQINAIEYEDGVMTKSPSKFRAYESYKDSFKDYVQFLKNNSRYQEALKYASDPREFAQQLQKASYATDTNYSNKIMQIYSSKRLNDLIAEQN
jgi:flagellar protein FlgJ